MYFMGYTRQASKNIACTVPLSRSPIILTVRRVKLLLPQSRTPPAEKNEYYMVVDLLLPQSRSPAVDKERQTFGYFVMFIFSFYVNLVNAGLQE